MNNASKFNNDFIVSGSISNEFSNFHYFYTIFHTSNSRTLIAILSILSKTTQNYTQFRTLFTATQKKKETRDRQSFLARFAWVLFFRDSLSVSLPR